MKKLDYDDKIISLVSREPGEDSRHYYNPMMYALSAKGRIFRLSPQSEAEWVEISIPQKENPNEEERV